MKHFSVYRFVSKWGNLQSYFSPMQFINFTNGFSGHFSTRKTNQWILWELFNSEDESVDFDGFLCDLITVAWLAVPRRQRSCKQKQPRRDDRSFSSARFRQKERSKPRSAGILEIVCHQNMVSKHHVEHFLDMMTWEKYLGTSNRSVKNDVGKCCEGGDEWGL